MLKCSLFGLGTQGPSHPVPSASVLSPLPTLPVMLSAPSGLSVFTNYICLFKSQSLLEVLSSWVAISSPGQTSLKTLLKCVLCGAFQNSQAELEALVMLYSHEMSLLTR